MKHAFLIAAICAFAPVASLAETSGFALEFEIESAPSESVQVSRSDSSDTTQDQGSLQVAESDSSGCSASGSSTSGRKCSTKGRPFTFPVMIGVYR